MTIQILCDLRGRFGPARDQGPRPTCLAFAASDAHAAARSGREPLSVEWVYYYAIQRDGGRPDDGATLGGMLDAVRIDGQPQEAAWPYISAPFIEPSSWKPPAFAGAVFRRGSEIVPPVISELLALLAGGSPVLVTMTLTDAFYRPGPDAVIASEEPIDPSRRHAVVAVGHGRDSEGVLVLVRNSWGHLWGNNGHAWLAERYLAPRLLRLAIMAEEL